MSADDHGDARARFDGRTDGRTDDRAACVIDANDDDADDGVDDDGATGRDDSAGETDANALGDFIVAEKTTDATHSTGADDGIRTQGSHHRSRA